MENSPAGNQLIDTGIAIIHVEEDLRKALPIVEVLEQRLLRHGDAEFLHSQETQQKIVI